MQILFLKFLFSLNFHFFAIATQLPGFSINRLANVEESFNVNIFFNFQLNIDVSINDHSLYSRNMLLKILFLLPHLFWNVDIKLIWLIQFQNKTNIEIIGF